MSKIFEKALIFTLFIALITSLCSCDSGIEKYQRDVYIGDEKMLYNYEIHDSPGFDTKLTIKYASDGRELQTIRFGGKPNSAEELIEVVNDEQCHIFRSYNLILYFMDGKIKTAIIQYESPEYFMNRSDEEQEELLNIYRSLLETYEYHYWYYFSEILIYNNDTEIINTIKQWANSNFSNHELLYNDDTILDCGYKQNEVIKWADKLVKDYGL